MNLFLKRNKLLFFPPIKFTLHLEDEEFIFIEKEQVLFGEGNENSWIHG
jgi:hypothetical protein